MDSSADFIQKEFIRQQKREILANPQISPEKLKELGMDVSKKEIRVGNLILKKDLLFTENYSINLIDKNKDLNGNPLLNHPEILKYVQKLWDKGERRVSFKELQNLKVFTPLTTIKTGNFELSSFSLLVSSNSYSISLIDEEKDGHGRWIDKAVNHKKVVKALESFKYPVSMYRQKNELTLNAAMEKHLRTYFDNCNKSKGKLTGAFDIEIGNMTYVIEIKLASSIKGTGQRDRAYGQMKRYLDEFNSKNFMLLIAGENADKQDANLKALKKAAESEFKVHFYFLEVE